MYYLVLNIYKKQFNKSWMACNKGPGPYSYTLCFLSELSHKAIYVECGFVGTPVPKNYDNVVLMKNENSSAPF